MTSTTKTLYAGHRYPPELISYTVWLYFRFPLSLRMVEEMLNRVQFENHDSVCPTVTLIKERNYDFQTRRGLARISAGQSLKGHFLKGLAPKREKGASPAGRPPCQLPSIPSAPHDEGASVNQAAWARAA